MQKSKVATFFLKGHKWNKIKLLQYMAMDNLYIYHQPSNMAD